MRGLIAGAAGVLILACSGLAFAFSSINATQAEFGALAEACRGRGVPGVAQYAGGGAAAMGIQIGDSGRVSVFPYAVPTEMRPDTLAAVHVVVCVEQPVEVLVERCPYVRRDDDPEGVSGVVERYRIEQRLRLVAAASGDTLAETSLQGEAPRACLEREAFRRGQETIAANGEAVTNAAMQDWVRAQLVSR